MLQAAVVPQPSRGVDASNREVSSLVNVARVGDIPAHGGLTVCLGAATIALFNMDGRIVAIEGVCLRCASLLANGTVQAREVACAGCGWRYDITTGRLPAIPKLNVDTFEVVVVGTQVMVRDPFA